MKILICNDDGINAMGLQILGRELAKIAEIYVAAPSSEKSGSSHGLTVVAPLRCHLHPLEGITDNAWAIDGTPADCAKLALEELMPYRPDIVVSGINHGPNLGTDIIYSGTVAGATEGYCLGGSAIAVSAAGMHKGNGDGNFQYAAEFTAKLCQKMEQDNFSPRMFLNINVPGQIAADVKGVKYTNMGWRWYTEPFEKREDPHGHDYYWLQGDIDDSFCGEGSDVAACNAGYISITPLQLDQTDHAMLEHLKQSDIIHGVF